MYSIIKFLEKISSQHNNPLKNQALYRLSDTYTNKLYQELLEQNFGKDGATATTITENEVLSLGARSLYLKIAIFASPTECYHFLDKIYEDIVNEKPGHYWELLVAIKKINDHCHNTKLYHTIDYLNFKSVSCNEMLFKNSGDTKVDLLPDIAVQNALRSLIKQHVEKIGAIARMKFGADKYRDQQIATAKALDNLGGNPWWRFKLLSITPAQFYEAGVEVHQLYQQRELKRALQIQGVMESIGINHANDEDNQMLQLLGVVEFYKKLEQKFNSDEIKQMQKDALRYKDELAAIKACEAEQQMAYSARNRNAMR